MENKVTINSNSQSAEFENRQLLDDYIPSELGMRGTNIGCDTTS